MSSFAEQLRARNLEDIVLGAVWRPILPLHTKSFVAAFTKCIQEETMFLVDADCDVDGYMSAKCFTTLFEKLNYEFFNVNHHIRKRHGVAPNLAASIAAQHYGAILIVDSSSSEMESLKILAQTGAEVFVVDHHDCGYEFEDYPENVHIINPRIELHKKTNIPYCDLSAGAISAMLCDNILATQYKVSNNEDIYCYGYVTIYSDACSLKNLYNVAYLKQFKGTKMLPPLIKMFMQKYQDFNRNFVSWYLVPRINALARSEAYDILWDLFFNERNSRMNQAELLTTIESIYLHSRAYAVDIADKCKIEEYPEYVIAYLDYDVKFKTDNYKGYIASQIADRYNKPTITLLHSGDNLYTGSVRDPFNRNLLQIFQTICDADGHPPAFGISLSAAELPNFIEAAKTIGPFLGDTTQDIIFSDWDSVSSPNDLSSEIRVMAEYNEYSGAGIPAAYALKTFDAKMSIHNCAHCKHIRWGTLLFVLMRSAISRGDKMVIAPTIGGNGIDLFIKNLM